ncbi:MAG: HupE/UreJ family protein, partial [Opitutaceae bacterium]|nr:HupE/UreJ family protein [Opitutaceae bacterium]
MNVARRLAFRLGLGLAALAASARAHDPGISTVEGKLSAGALVLVTGFAPADATQLIAPAARKEGSWDQADFDAVHAELRRLALRLWEVKEGDTVLAPADLSVQLLPGDNVSFRHVFPLSRGGDGLRLRAPLLGELSDSHRQFAIVVDEMGSVIVKKLLSARDPAFETPGPASPPAPPPSDWAIAWGFFRQGVLHLWTGYDHILFLLALLVVCTRFRDCLVIITSFTVAHSLTLALAALEVLSLPARLVEPVIAASIVYVGVENLLRRGAEPRGRWALTFAFGLVHGFGFAGVLRELGLGAGGQGIALPLLTFNLGVEAGQIAIAAVVLPLL